MKYLALLLIALSPMAGQYQRRRVPQVSSKAGDALNGVVVSFHGKLVEISKREITIATEDQPIFNIGRTGKTKFLQDGKSIKPEAIPVGAQLTVDVKKDPDLNPEAVNVIVETKPAIKPGGSPT